MSKIKLKIYFGIGFLLFCALLQAQFNLSNSTEILYNISLSGAVDNPGVFSVPPSTRVSSVLKLSKTEYLETMQNQQKLEKPDEELELLTKKFEEYYPKDTEEIGMRDDGSLRNILVLRGEKKIKVDLLKFFVLGDDDNNPYVMDGDIIYVPAKRGTVNISGAVNQEGKIEITESDRISDIVDLALGTKPEAWLEAVEIVRFKEDSSTEKIVVNLEKIISNPDSKENIPIKLDDRIYVRTIPDFHQKTTVMISGEVAFPGEYVIEEGKTTLLELLQLCGNPTADADLYNSFVQRQTGIEEIDPEFERLKTMSVNQMNKLEYAYFKNAVRELKGKYSVDFAALLNDSETSTNILLKDGDLIVIPRKSSFINITGQVVYPGLVAYTEGKSFSYYIEKAGGLNWNARKSKIRLIRANSGKWIKPKAETVIMQGDIIFVPEKPEFDAWQFTLDSLRIVSQIATLILVVQNLTGS